MLHVDDPIELHCGLGTARVHGSPDVVRSDLALRARQRRSLGAEAHQQEQRKEEAFHRRTHGRLDKLWARKLPPLLTRINSLRRFDASHGQRFAHLLGGKLHLVARFHPI